jgi:succinate dehydrogenase / fumarate reductase, iron-sulfur subunit
VTAVDTSPTTGGAADHGEAGEVINLTLFVWRQPGPDEPGAIVKYDAPNISTHMSFLEMLDVVNERLIKSGGEPIAFDHDCREGICGTCGLMINGIAHGPERATTTCQLHMRHFSDGATVYIEPWRANPFPVIKDLIVDRGAFDRIIEAGGYITAATGGAPEANGLPVPKPDADTAFDAAACIGCGACVAACPNTSAMLFVGAKVGHLANMPQGEPERRERVRKMVEQHDAEGFGHCSNYYECEAACPKEISVRFIGQLNREYVRAGFDVGARDMTGAGAAG